MFCKILLEYRCCLEFYKGIERGSRKAEKGAQGTRGSRLFTHIHILTDLAPFLLNNSGIIASLVPWICIKQNRADFSHIPRSQLAFFGLHMDNILPGNILIA